MAKQTINIGTTANDGTGDPLRTAFTKVNENFTELYNANLNTGSITFEGIAIVGDTTDLPQGSLELVPNDGVIPEGQPNEGDLYTSWGQYVRIYPTWNADAPHIHITAGSGENSNGDLFLGDDLKYVQVNHDGTISIANGVGNKWIFSTDGKLQFPTVGTIAAEGMGWTGLSNGTTETPVSLVYKTNTGNWHAAISVYGGGDPGGGGSIVLYTYNADTEQSYQWEFDLNGNLVLPINGSIKDSNNNYLTPKSSTVAPLITNVLSGVVSDPPSNPNWLNGTGVAGGVSNANLSFSITSGAPSFTINDPGLPGRYVGETIFNINGSVLGGTDGIDDMIINVSSITNTGSGVIDLTKQTHVLESGDYTLADGYEGQVLYFIPKVGATNVFGSIWIQAAHVRYINPSDGSTSEFTNAWWSPFYKANDNYILNGVATAVFADDAWNFTGGIID